MLEQPAEYLGIASAQWIEMLQSDDPLERRLAAHALGEIGPAATAALPALTAALHDSTTFVRVWAAAAIARIEPANTVALPALIEEMKGRISFVRSLAAWHVGRLGATFPDVHKCLPILWELLEDYDPSVGMEAALALKNLEGKGAPPQELQSLARLSKFKEEAVLLG